MEEKARYWESADTWECLEVRRYGDTREKLFFFACERGNCIGKSCEAKESEIEIKEVWKECVESSRPYVSKVNVVSGFGQACNSL